MIKGIGPKLAERIVGQFKEETFTVIEQTPDRLLEVSGIGVDRTSRITAAWHEQKQVKEIMVFLHGHGVSTNLAVKIYKTYGDKSLETVQQNPYQLERDIYGVGFKTADRLAQVLGLPADHPSRIEAGIVFALNEMINEGHVYVPKELLAQHALELLEVAPELISPALERLAQDDRIRPEVIPFNNKNDGKTKQAVSESAGMYGTPVIYLTPFFFGEKGVAERLKTLAGAASPARAMNRSLFPTENLSDEQQTAIDMALTHPISILTGGPGTGKTTCLKALITSIEAQHKKCALASPTGRAASTIHRLLEFSPLDGFQHNEDYPLDLDFLVVDEASMLDLLLTNRLLKAIRPGTHILFVGDVDQLPSVGAGDVMRDLIRNETVPITRLTNIFRQAANSKIITNAHLINQGKSPVFSQGEGDFFLFPAEDAVGAADWILEIVTERIPQKFGFNTVHDIQVLALIYRGPAGVIALNDRLQEKLNPPADNKPG